MIGRYNGKSRKNTKPKPRREVQEAMKRISFLQSMMASADSGERAVMRLEIEELRKKL